MLKLAEFEGLEQRCRKIKLERKRVSALKSHVCLSQPTVKQVRSTCSKHVVSKRLKMQRFRTASFFGVKYTAILSDKSSTSTSEKKMPKRVGASAQPCFTPFLIGKGPEAEPSYWTVPCISSWKDVIILRSLDGHPILCRRVDRPFLLIRSTALVRSIKAIYSDFLYSRHFSCSCLSEKIMSIVDLPVLNRAEPRGTPFPLTSPTCSTPHGQGPSQ